VTCETKREKKKRRGGENSLEGREIGKTEKVVTEASWKLT